MAAVILLASNGIVLAFHTCFTAKKTAVSLFHHGECDSEKKQPSKRKSSCCSNEKRKPTRALVNSNCCVETITYKKSELTSTIMASSEVVVHDIFIINHFTPFAIPFINSSKTFAFLNKAPPPFTASHSDFLFATGLLLI
jgi:hypothetical protein